MYICIQPKKKKSPILPISHTQKRAWHRKGRRNSDHELVGGELYIGDRNRHISKDNCGYEMACEGHEYGVKNCLNIAMFYDLMIPYTCFKKRDGHLISFKSLMVDKLICKIIVKLYQVRA